MEWKTNLFKGLLIWTFFLSGAIQCWSQAGIHPTGVNASGGGGHVTYSLGQLVYHLDSSFSGSLSEGVQQPFEIFILSETDGNEGVNFSVDVYPTPTMDYLTLDMGDHPLSSISFELFDVHGKKLASLNVTSKLTSLDLFSLEPAAYILRVKDDGEEIKTFKIVKN